jgi:hypothetical protein
MHGGIFYNTAICITFKGGGGNKDVFNVHHVGRSQYSSQDNSGHQDIRQQFSFCFVFRKQFSYTNNPFLSKRNVDPHRF